MIAEARPAKPRTLLANVRIERGTRDDWLALARFHYRSHQAGAVTDVFRMVYEATCATGAGPSCVHGGLSRRLVGALVYSRSPLSLAARDRATGGRYRTAGMGRTAAGYLINRELRIISRVVLAPNWRGLGLASRLVAETLPHAGTPYVEAMAAMGEMHPLFERAGMTASPQRPAPQGPRRLLDREVERWARSYLGAKNHRTCRLGRERMLDLAARHLDSVPVYYLWRTPRP
jgi:GNAT superfamily N-acetyltransferase